MRPCLGLALAGSLAFAEGCTRRFYRHRADEEVSTVLAEKDKYPAWAIEQWHVYPDPHARFADPTNPDRPPRPPDDPAAYDLSPNPQKVPHAGIALVEGAGYLELLDAWDKENRAEAAAKPGAGQGVERTQTETQEKGGRPEPGVERTPESKKDSDGGAKKGDQKPYAGEAAASTTSLSSKPKPGQRPPYLLKLEQAVELGLVNSREYQDRREDLYLTALPVTLERFSFAAQFFAAGQAIREWAGRQTPEGHQDNWTLNSNAGFAKLFPTGALLLFNFANQTIINMSGPLRGDARSQSSINLDLIQPLLRGGGRAVTLEPLTQSERNLLYEIRTYARFRKEFYVAIAGGGGGSITGSAFQPVGVLAPTSFAPGQGIGASGLIPGVIPGVPVASNPGLNIGPGSSGRIPLSTALAAPVSGYLTTLLQAAQMQVDEYNIARFQEFLNLSRAFLEGGDLSQLQVDLIEQQLLVGRSRLLTDQLQYLQSLDQFKLQLGVPTNLSIELDDAAFRPLTQQFRRYEDLFKQYVAASEEPERFRSVDLVASVRRELRRIFLTAAITEGTPFRTQIEARWGAWEKLSADELERRLTAYSEERRRLLGKKTDLETKGQTLSPDDERRLHDVQFEIDLGLFEKVLRNYETQPWKNVLDPVLRGRRQQNEFRYVQNKFIDVLTEARNERLARLRRQWPDLARLCVNGVDLLKADLGDAQGAVIQAALVNRLDLMNVRAQLVDAWRQLAVFANALLGTFNVQYHLDSATPAAVAQPLNFNARRTRQELLLNWELPLVRKEERNNYRASLINYQRARRILQRAEDQVAYDTRLEIRQLRQQEENYRIQQRQVELGYLSVENSLDTFRAPPAPGPAGDIATRGAALTQQLIQAQNQLTQAQFSMTTIWITYLNTRLQLYRDMELMPLDNRGVWIDEIATRECPGGSACGSSELGPSGPGGGPDAPGGERPERIPEPKPVPPPQGAAVEQAH
jgi:outer membrane protein TolC